MASARKSAHHRKPVVPRDLGLNDMRRFHRGLDLAVLWEEFQNTVDASGRLRFKTSRQLALKIGVNDKQKEFLTWLLGPGDAQGNLLYPFAKPVDFDGKRAQGGWFSEDKLRAQSKAICREINALEAMRAAGNGIIVNSLARMESLSRRLDEEFGGSFFADGLSAKENRERALLYVQLHERLLLMLGRAQDLYAKSHGINFADMSGFERLIAAQAMIAASSSGMRESRVGKVLKQIVEAALDKSVKYAIPLPADVEQCIVEEIESEPGKKSVM